MFVLLYSVAGIPTGVTVNRTAATSVKVSWTAPSSGQGVHVGNYEVFYQMAANKSSRTTSNTELTLNGLTVGETYSMFVVAYGAKGAPVLPSAHSNTAMVALCK